MAEYFAFEANCKFAIVAIHNVRADVAPGVILQDGTRVWGHFPFTLDECWKDWLGTSQFNSLAACNLFLVRSVTEGWQNGYLTVAGDVVSEKLQWEVGSLFAMLRFLGTIEYEDAFVLAGHVENGNPMCRHFAKTERFNKMRCDIEHVHDWDRSLQVYPSAGREDQALWRTRQMEALACGIYKGILLEPILQAEFCSDASLKAFWQKPADVIRATLGNICDITQMKVVKQYDSFGRAGTSNWPKGWGENLRRKADVSLSSTSPTLGLN